jgi:hypothetical protein
MSLDFTLLRWKRMTHKHSIIIVQTTLNVTACYNKIRYSKVGGLYRKYANEVTEKIQLLATAKKKK